MNRRREWSRLGRGPGMGPDDPIPSVVRRLDRASHDEEVWERGLRHRARSREIAEIAVRTHVEPEGWEPWLPKLDHVPFPGVAMVLETVRVPGTDILWFLVWMFLPDARVSGGPGAIGIAYPDHLPASDVETIRRTAAELGIAERHVEPWETFLKRFFKWAYRRPYRVPVVAWRLPEVLGLMAADWLPALEGGWDLILWTQPDRQRKRRRRG